MSPRTLSSGEILTDEHFVELVQKELAKAREKFPSPNHSFTALVEEVGELAQALLKWSAGKWDYQRVIDEAIQVATMAQRIVVEGDSSYEKTDYVEP